LSKTKREKLFELFDQGCTTTSPEIKALVAKSGTRNAYISEWRKARGIKPVEPPLEVSAPSSRETSLPKGESVKVVTDAPKTNPPPLPRTPIKPFVDPFNETGYDGNNENGGEGGYDSGEEQENPEGNGTGEEEKQKSIPIENDGKISPIRDQRIAGPKPSQFSIAGHGLNITAVISVKTMALYEIARAAQKELEPNSEELSLGDFIDVCVEDTYQGRGQDLGLIAIGR
jgi:hypothetical protein